MDDNKPRVTWHGKQVMLDDRHLADAVSEEAAIVIAICLNNITSDCVDHDQDVILTSFFA